MRDSPDGPTRQPFLVRLGLLGLKSRQAALGFMWLCILGAMVSVLLKVWIGSLLLLAALWYGYAITWVDKNGGWK